MDQKHASNIKHSAWAMITEQTIKISWLVIGVFLELKARQPYGQPCSNPCSKACTKPCCVRSGVSCGVPFGVFSGEPCGVPCSVFCGVPCGVPCGVLCGVPCGMPCGKPLAPICIILFVMLPIDLPSSSFGGILFWIMSITPSLIAVNRSATFRTSNCQ